MQFESENDITLSVMMIFSHLGISCLSKKVIVGNTAW